MNNEIFSGEINETYMAYNCVNICINHEYIPGESSS